MREFFNGWRRKVGCVALVMVLFLAFGWIRSQTVADAFSNSFAPGSTAMLLSVDGCVAWSVYDSGDYRRPRWEVTPRSELVGIAKEPMIAWHWQWLGFRIGKVHNLISLIPFSQIPAGAVVTIPYWSLILPLTLLSAYLLVWKPRKRREVPDA